MKNLWITILMGSLHAGCGKKETVSTKQQEPQKIKVVSISPKEKGMIEKAIRMEHKKPTGQLTKEDLEKVRSLDFEGTGGAGITDGSLKEVAKLQKLEWLILDDTKITEMGVDEFQKVLPTCEIKILR